MLHQLFFNDKLCFFQSSLIGPIYSAQKNGCTEIYVSGFGLRNLVCQGLIRRKVVHCRVSSSQHHTTLQPNQHTHIVFSCAPHESSAHLRLLSVNNARLVTTLKLGTCLVKALISFCILHHLNFRTRILSNRTNKHNVCRYC